MKRVVSVSLGSSRGNKAFKVSILGTDFSIERIGTDGDLEKFRRLFCELDGKVDALGIGGADLYIVAGNRRYEFKQIRQLIAGAKSTPVVDGSGLKNTLERQTVVELQKSGEVDFSKERVLLVSAVDRFGMAQSLYGLCPNVVCGDLMFAIGLPLRIRSYGMVRFLAAAVLPVITRCPFQWFYPTGEKQDLRSPKCTWAFDEATVIAGDKHYIRKYAPDRLDGKTVITQSIRKDDIEWLRKSGAKRLITTTPEMGGETFATNVIEGVLVALLGRRPEELTPEDYLEALRRLNWKPNVFPL
jgi:hypothetical protein